MTIASTRTRELDIGSIVLNAYRMAGLLNEHQALTQAKTDVGKELLETIIKELQIYGITARSVVLERITLVAGTREYTLSADVFDVVGSAVHIDGDEADPEKATAEFAVTMMDRETRQLVSSKAATGVPSLFYVDRTVYPLKVWLYPIPAEAGWMRFQVHRLSADNNDTTKTSDLERFWAQYLIWELAHQLAVANTLNPARIGHLASVAAQKLVMCRAYANPRGSQQMTLDHSTSWGRS